MTNKITIPEEVILTKIFLVRGQKVMLDNDLAELYQLETKQLKRQVRRNLERFPEDFLFELPFPTDQIPLTFFVHEDI